MKRVQVHPLAWLAKRDQNLAALRRAGRTAIVVPAMFALSSKVIDNEEMALFTAFGGIATLLLVDFSGQLRDRVLGLAGLGVTGAVFVCLATLASRSPWLAALSMAVVAFLVLFSGIVSSVLAGASTSLLLSFMLPVMVPGPVSDIPDRMAGWLLSAAAALIAVPLLWPAPARSPLRAPAAAACVALAARLRSDVGYVLGEGVTQEAHDESVARANDAIAALQKTFLATPYRPTGLNTSARTVVRLVDDLNWLMLIIQAGPSLDAIALCGQPSGPACSVKVAAAAVLDRAATVLTEKTDSVQELQSAIAELEATLHRMEHHATVELPARRIVMGDGSVAVDEGADEAISSLDPAFRAQELSFAVSQIGHNVEITAVADHRRWFDRLLGRQPEGVTGPLTAAGRRAAAHLEPHSVWLHNSVRGAVALGIAVYVAYESGLSHSFWVVLGALSVLRSSALNTGQNAFRALLGTVVGFIIAAGVLELVGTNATVLWFLLPVAILLAGIAPAAISFTAGQAAFTITVVILFNILDPEGWKVGLVRVEDVAIGCSVSLLVGLLFWPRGAGAALGRALAQAYAESARYVAHAVGFGMTRCDGSGVLTPAPTADALRALAASARLDDAFRTYLAERGTKAVPLAKVTRLITGVAALRLAADAVLDLWDREDGTSEGDRTTSRQLLLKTGESVQGWYDSLGESLSSGAALPEPQGHDHAANDQLIGALRRDLRGADGMAGGTAVRLIWTADHLDAARRLQASIVDPAKAVAGEIQLGRFNWITPTWIRRRIPALQC